MTYHFGTKAVLLAELVDATVAMELDDEPPIDVPAWIAAVRSASDGPAAVRAFISSGRVMLRRTSGLDVVMRAAALTDPDVKVVRERSERIRREQMRLLVDTVAERGWLRADLDIERAVDVFISLFGAPLYLALHHDRGWSDDDTVAWLTETVIDALIRPPDES